MPVGNNYSLRLLGEVTGVIDETEGGGVSPQILVASENSEETYNYGYLNMLDGNNPGNNYDDCDVTPAGDIYRTNISLGNIHPDATKCKMSHYIIEEVKMGNDGEDGIKMLHRTVNAASWGNAISSSSNQPPNYWVVDGAFSGDWPCGGEQDHNLLPWMSLKDNMMHLGVKTVNDDQFTNETLPSVVYISIEDNFVMYNYNQNCLAQLMVVTSNWDKKPDNYFNDGVNGGEAHRLKRTPNEHQGGNYDFCTGIGNAETYYYRLGHPMAYLGPKTDALGVSKITIGVEPYYSGNRDWGLFEYSYADNFNSCYDRHTDAGDDISTIMNTVPGFSVDFPDAGYISVSYPKTRPADWDYAYNFLYGEDAPGMPADTVSQVNQYDDDAGGHAYIGNANALMDASHAENSWNGVG